MLIDEMKKEFGQMKFDVVIGNPPYNKGMDLDFVDLGYKISNKYTVMITPAKWQTTADDYSGCASKNINYKQFREMYVPHIQNIAKSLMSVTTIDTARSIQNLQESMKLFTDSVIAEQISQLESIDYSKIFSQTLQKNGTFKDAVDAAYESLQEEENISENVELETDFASEQEIQDTINDQMNNPVGFQERVANWAAEKYKKYFIVINFWLLIWGIFIQPYLQENLGLPAMTYVESNVKELPEKGAKIVAQLKENIEATIIENTNYYYKVTFTDEDGVQREGYVAKRNLKIIKEPEAEETEEKLPPEE